MSRAFTFLTLCGLLSATSIAQTPADFYPEEQFPAAGGPFSFAIGDLDLNSYQHQPYLDNANADRGYKLVSIAKTVIFPIGIYSKTIKSLSELKEGARIALPNDPTNGGRALLLLQANGLIKLRPEAGLKATPIAVVEML